MQCHIDIRMGRVTDVKQKMVGSLRVMFDIGDTTAKYNYYVGRYGNMNIAMEQFPIDSVWIVVVEGNDKSIRVCNVYQDHAPRYPVGTRLVPMGWVFVKKSRYHLLPNSFKYNVDLGLWSIQIRANDDEMLLVSERESLNMLNV